MRLKLLKTPPVFFSTDHNVDEPTPLGNPLDIPGRNECKFIYGDVHVGNWYCCGNITIPHKSWCSYHANVVYEPETNKRKPDIEKDYQSYKHKLR